MDNAHGRYLNALRTVCEVGGERLAKHDCCKQHPFFNFTAPRHMIKHIVKKKSPIAFIHGCERERERQTKEKRQVCDI